MKKILLFFFIICSIAKAQTWQQLDDFPGSQRDDGIAFVIDHKAYCGTGFQVGWSTTRDFYRLDLENDSWINIASLPPGSERQYACGGSYLAHGYIFGGVDGGGNFLNDFWMYDPSSDQWSLLPSKPGEGMSGASSFVMGNTWYVFGGKNSTTMASREMWAYNFSTSAWTQKKDLPFNGCWRASSTVVNASGYVLFGLDANFHFQNELYAYNPDKDTWSMESKFPLDGRIYSSIQNINNQLVIFAGLDSSNKYYNDLWTYDLSSKEWKQEKSLPSFGRKGGMCFLDNPVLYYTTGINQSNTRLQETWKATFPAASSELSLSLGFRIYPNPVKDIAYLAFPENDICAECSLKIYDSTGRLVKHGLLENNNQISVSDLNNGLYQVILSNSERQYSNRMVIW